MSSTDAINPPDSVWDRLVQERVVAVVVIDDVSTAIPTVEALQEGGINAIELALRTPQAMSCIHVIRKAAPDLLLGTGTVLTPQQVHQCKDAGASFGVSPGFNRRVVQEAHDVGLPFAPGITTPSDIEAAVEMGCRHLKFFPAEPSGGLPYLSSIAAPYKHLGLRYIPLGGIDRNNIEAYLKHPLIMAVGGSWLCPPELIRSQNWKLIRENAKAVKEQARQSAQPVQASKE